MANDWVTAQLSLAMDLEELKTIVVRWKLALEFTGQYGAAMDNAVASIQEVIEDLKRLIYNYSPEPSTKGEL